MSRGSAKLTETRRKEILQACESIYAEKNYKDITLKEIADATSITRTAMYTWYRTKEEIFMHLLAAEHERWNKSLREILAAQIETKEELAGMIASSLDNRLYLLKLMSMNVFELEENSRYERVVEYKIALGDSMKLMRRIITVFCPEKTEQETEEFIYAVFPMIFGLYPYSVINEKAQKAMEEAGVDFHYYSIHELAYRGILQLLR